MSIRSVPLMFLLTLGAPPAADAQQPANVARIGYPSAKLGAQPERAGITWLDHYRWPRRQRAPQYPVDR